MNKISALFVIALGLLAGCSISPRISSVAPPVKRAATHAGFTAEAFFVLEFEHDTAGNLVNAAPYGPTDSEFKAMQDEVMRKARVSQYNPAGFTSQFTIQHVEFKGPLGPKGAVVVQPVARNQPAPKAWVLFATDFDAHGKYLGAEMLHAVALSLACQHDARDVIDSNPHAAPPGASLLIYCVPVPPLPTDTTLPNGDSVL
jgi:hypothetical protein